MQIAAPALRLHVVDVDVVTRANRRACNADNLAVLAHWVAHFDRHHRHLMTKRHGCGYDDATNREIHNVVWRKIRQRNGHVVRRVEVVRPPPGRRADRA